MGWAEPLKNATITVKRVLTYDRDGNPATYADAETFRVRHERNVERTRQLGLDAARGDILSDDTRPWSVDDRVWLPGDTVGSSPVYGRRVLAEGASGVSGFYTYWAAL